MPKATIETAPISKDVKTFLIALPTAMLYKLKAAIEDQIAWRQEHSSHGGFIEKEMEIKGSKYTLSSLRSEALQILGGRCQCCKETDVRTLEIDHVAGDGSKERKTMNRDKILRKVIQSNGDGYQLLCANCHRKKTHSEGEFS